MILQKGDLVLVAHRRLYKEDPLRFFTGTVDHYDDGCVRITGSTWYREPLRGTIVRKKGERTKVLSIASGTFLLYVIDVGAGHRDLDIQTDPNGEIWLVYGKDLRMNLAEREVEHLR